MAGLHVDPIRGALAYLSLLAFLCTGEALAQPIPSAPATLRLAQVVVRLPKVHLYASAQDENGNPIAEGQWGDPKALIGPIYTNAEISQLSEGIAIVFLIDISASLNQTQFEMIKASVRSWIGRLGTNDRAAIVTLGSSVKTVQDFTANQSLLSETVNKLEARDKQTLLYQGLVQAIDLSRRVDRNLPLRRAIVVLTDGIDDQQGGAGRQEVLDKLAVDPTPVYGLGASSHNNTKVDAALKDFAGLVRASGGDYQRIDRIELGRLNDGYERLRNIVSSTKHLTAECPAYAAACAPDGSPIAVRLYLSPGAARLSSESVTVRLVNDRGEVIRPPPPLPPPPPWWKGLLDFLANLPPQWKAVLALLALLAGGSVAGVTLRLSFPDFFGRFVILMWGRPKETPNPEPKATSQEPVLPAGLSISKKVLIPSGTLQYKQRLRLYPIGHNEIGSFDLLFEKTLAVGRSPDSEICISNDGQVSANHCALSPKGKSILVQDSNSRNGTRVNGVPINGFLHAEPDSVLGVGRTELRMKLLPEGAT